MTTESSRETPFGPVRLNGDNMPPPSRTPWGGTILRERYGKAAYRATGVIGESWEFSVEPSFPSRFYGKDETLVDAIRTAPEAWLGAATAGRFTLPHLLVKLLDAADNLSLQVHPHVVAAPGGDSGKHETWWILDAEPGAGIYLGFKPGTNPDDLVEQIRARGPVSETMNFVPVSAGDVFHIRPGTPHAIGRGVTLFEPQAICPGRKGVTYRCWDWNRLYDAEGRRSEGGEARELHLQRFLEVTAWERVCTEGFVERCREVPRRIQVEELDFRYVNGSPWYDVIRVVGDGVATLDTEDHLTVITCLSGKLHVEASGHAPLELPPGTSAAVPAALGRFRVRAERGDYFIVRDTPLRAHQGPRQAAE